jgi:hypothetical protein
VDRFLRFAVRFRLVFFALRFLAMWLPLTSFSQAQSTLQQTKGSAVLFVGALLIRLDRRKNKRGHEQAEQNRRDHQRERENHRGHSANDPTDGSVIFAAFAFKLRNAEMEKPPGARRGSTHFRPSTHVAAFSRSMTNMAAAHNASAVPPQVR